LKFHPSFSIALSPAIVEEGKPVRYWIVLAVGCLRTRLDRISQRQMFSGAACPFSHAVCFARKSEGIVEVENTG
jgi:hypothetical protein